MDRGRVLLSSSRRLETTVVICGSFTCALVASTWLGGSDCVLCTVVVLLQLSLTPKYLAKRSSTLGDRVPTVTEVISVVCRRLTGCGCGCCCCTSRLIFLRISDTLGGARSSSCDCWCCRCSCSLEAQFSLPESEPLSLVPFASFSVCGFSCCFSMNGDLTLPMVRE